MRNDSAGERPEVLMNAAGQPWLAGDANPSQHRSSHLAELILDEAQP
jgi:hypothetical protein